MLPLAIKLASVRAVIFMHPISFSVLLPGEWGSTNAPETNALSFVNKIPHPTEQILSSPSSSNQLNNRTSTSLTPLLTYLQTIAETQKLALKTLKEEVEKQQKSWQGVEAFLQGIFRYPKYVLRVNKHNFFPMFEFFIFKLNLVDDSSLNRERVGWGKEGLEQVGSKGVRAIVLFVANCLKIYFLRTLEKKIIPSCQMQEMKQILDHKSYLRAHIQPNEEAAHYLDELEQIQKELEEIKDSVQNQLKKTEREIGKPKNLFDSLYFLVNVSSHLISSSCKIVLKVAKPVYHICDSHYQLKKIEEFQNLSRKKQQALKDTQETKLLVNRAASSPSKELTLIPQKSEPLSPFFSFLKEIRCLLGQTPLGDFALQKTAHDISFILDREKPYRLLKKREEQRIKEMKEYLEPHIKECEKLSSGEEVKCYLVKTLEIDLQELPNYLEERSISKQRRSLPQDKEEWLSALKDQRFYLFFANKHLSDLEREETRALLLQRGLYQALLSKHKREEQVLSFRKFEQGLRLLLSYFQLSLLPFGKFAAPLSLLNWLLEDLAKLLPGLSLAYLIFPDYRFKLEAIVCLVAEDRFSKMYKPYEYSLEGYQLRLEKRGILVCTYLLKVRDVCEDVVIWIKFQAIEFSLSRIKQTPEARERRYQEMTESVRKRRLYWENRLAHIDNQLQLLRKKDAAFTVSPKFMPKQQNQTIFDVLQEEMEKTNFSYTPEIKSWLEENVKIRLESSKNTPEIKEQLSQFFSKNYEEFLQA